MAQTAMAQPAMTQASVPAQVFKTKAETKHGLQNHDWAQSLVSPPLGPSPASEKNCDRPTMKPLTSRLAMSAVAGTQNHTGKP